MGILDRLKSNLWSPKELSDDVGPEILDFLFSGMAIDARWSVRDSRSFTWWGHTLAQRVWAEKPVQSDGCTLVRVHAETNLRRSLQPGPPLWTALDILNRTATLSAFLWHPHARRITLHCAITIHRENFDWASRFLLGAIGIQAADAHIKVGLSEMLGGEPDISGHPRHGARQEADDMLNAIATLFSPKGQGPSPFTQDDFESALRMNPEPWVLATGGNDGLTAEFAFSGNRPAVQSAVEDRKGLETALLTATAEERHPQLGSGALLILSLPVTMAVENAATLALDLNREESVATPTASPYFLGAWSSDKVRGLSFVTFLPAALYRQGLLPLMVFSAGLRTRWAREFLKARPRE